MNEKQIKYLLTAAGRKTGGKTGTLYRPPEGTAGYCGKILPISYWCGSGHCKIVKGQRVPVIPTVGAILESLHGDIHCADNAASFEEFCGNFGYDPDSRDAYKVFEACLKLRSEMQELLDEQFDAFLAISPE